MDLFSGRHAGFRPLLVLGPTFASLWCGIRRTALVGMVALVMFFGVSVFDHALGRRSNTLMIVTTLGVTLASVVACAERHRRERLLASVRSVAEVAQQVLLRPVPRLLGSVHVAVSYTSATAEARIGGDLYEVASTRSGVRIIVGDVQGKGIDAVETAAAVLGAFREAAYDEPDLPGVVARIEVALRRRLDEEKEEELREEKFVTAVLAEIVDNDTVTLVNLGHPPPFVIGEDGCVTVAEPEDVAPPLGLNGLADATPRTHAVKFAPGDQMLFYTDGVIEARDRAGRFYPLAERVSHLTTADDPQNALEELRSDVLHHVGGPIADDAAMLLIRHR